MAAIDKCSDDEFLEAVRRARSWREVLRQLGTGRGSGGEIVAARERAAALGASHAHFAGQRSWSDNELRSAVEIADSWADVISALSLRGGSALATLRGHAARLGIDTAHLDPAVQRPALRDLMPARRYLDRAGTMLAAAWFTLSGCDVSWPLEPCRYDLIASQGAEHRRVQVKTTTTWMGTTWKVYLSTTHGGRRTYSPEEIDDFFVIDGDLNCFVIPINAVGGLHALHLTRYQQFRVPRLYSFST